MNNNRRTRELPKILLTQFFVGLIMVVLALIVLFFAQGYRFNFKNFKVIKTGLVFLSSYPKDAEVYLDGKLQGDKTPFTRNLVSGNYNVEIDKSGFKSWYNSFKIEPELVTEYKAIVLFKSDIKISDLGDQSKIELLNSPYDNLATIKDEGDLVFNDYEIWQDGKLVTRFSEPILNAIWYPDMQHILYQKGNEIRVIDIDGSNDVLLVTLTQNTLTRFTVNNKGDQLYFVDNGQYKMAQIR